MKRTLSAPLLMLSLLFAIALAGCGNAAGGAGDQPGGAPQAAQQEQGQEQQGQAQAPTETVGEDGVKPSSDSSDFVLLSEAVPDTYFTFPINSDSLAPSGAQ